jgi:hypothetical protein
MSTKDPRKKNTIVCQKTMVCIVLSGLGPFFVDATIGIKKTEVRSQK